MKEDQQSRPLPKALELARPPIELEPGVHVHSSSDRRLAAEHWMLSSVDDPKRVRQEWNVDGVAMLPLGTLFSAVRLPADLVLAIIGGQAPSRDVDQLLDEVLDGPVICDPRHQRYYVVVPASMPRTWHRAADDWSEVDVDCLGRGTYLGVPKLDALELRTLTTYWSVPMKSAAALCSPLAVARLIAAGRHGLLRGQDAT
ncbi:hypothetical protein [Streptomyces sp. NPDC002547]